jgi:hypothetical protein
MERPVGANLFTNVLEIRGEVPVDTYVAGEIMISNCFPKHGMLFPIDHPEAGSAIQSLIESRSSDESVFLDFVDGRVEVFLFAPPAAGEPLINNPLPDDQARELGLTP